MHIILYNSLHMNNIIENNQNPKSHYMFYTFLIERKIDSNKHFFKHGVARSFSLSYT